MPRARKAQVEPVPGQQHGERAQQEAQLAQVRAAAGSAGIPPVTPLSAPSERPDEPVTAGLSIGEGPGPEVLGMQRSQDPTLARLQALYLAHPNEDLRRLLEHAESNLTLPELSA